MKATATVVIQVIITEPKMGHAFLSWYGETGEQGLPRPSVSVPKAQQCWQQLFLRVNRCSAGRPDRQSWRERGQLHAGTREGEEGEKKAAPLLTKLAHVHQHGVFFSFL